LKIGFSSVAVGGVFGGVPMNRQRHTSLPLWFDVRVWVFVLTLVFIALGSVSGVCFYLGAELVAKYEGLRFAIGIFALFLGLMAFIEAVLLFHILSRKVWLFQIPKFVGCEPKNTQANKQRNKADKSVS